MPLHVHQIKANEMSEFKFTPNQPNDNFSGKTYQKEVSVITETILELKKEINSLQKKLGKTNVKRPTDC